MFLGLFQGCDGFFTNEHLFWNYYLTATDVEDDLALSYHRTEDGSNYGGIIPATVFATGYNKKYIIVKQHPKVFSRSSNKKIINYFILPIYDGFNYTTLNGLIGPITEDQFVIKRHDLGIPDSLSFFKEYENLK